MLVLSRQRDETIIIGDDIEITVVDIRGDKVRLGITAPTRISVHRKEVYEAIRSENARAAQISSTDIAALKVAASGNGGNAPVKPLAPNVGRGLHAAGPGSGASTPAANSTARPTATRLGHPQLTTTKIVPVSAPMRMEKAS